MPQPHIPVPVKVIEYPICGGCGALMQLSRIEPAERGHEQRYFECPDCGWSKSIAAEIE